MVSMQNICIKIASIHHVHIHDIPYTCMYMYHVYIHVVIVVRLESFELVL